MTGKEINDLTNDEKAVILDKFIININVINKKSGCVIGTYQILDMIDKTAIDEGYIECPMCHNMKVKK